MLSSTSIFFGSVRNELLVRNHYEVQSMIVLTQYHLMKEDTVLSDKMTMHFQHGMVLVEKITEQSYQFSVTLTNHYQEDKVITLNKTKKDD